VTTEIQQNRYDALLRRVGDLKGPGSKVSEVLAELFPVFDVENLPGELFLLSGTLLAFGGGGGTGAATQAVTGMLHNPADSGTLITLTNVHSSVDATNVMRWGIGTGTTGFSDLGTTTPRDTRVFTPAVPVGRVLRRIDTTLATGTNQVQLLANTDIDLHDENGIAILAPSMHFQIGSAALVQTGIFTFVWRERPAEPSELNL